MGDTPLDNAYEPPRLIPGFGLLDPHALERVREALALQPEPAPAIPEEPLPDSPEEPDKAELPKKRKPKASLGAPEDPPLRT